MSRKSHRSWRLALSGLIALLAVLILPPFALADQSPATPIVAAGTTTPTKVVFDEPLEDVCAGRLTVRWKPSVDADGTVVAYRVTVGDRAPVEVSGTSYTISEPLGEVEVTVHAIDNDGNVSAPSTETYLVTVANCAPTRPVVNAVDPTDTTVSLRWTAATAPDGTIKEYRVYRNGTRVKVVTGTSAQDTGLSPDTEYVYEVAAVDDNDFEGPRSLPVKARTARTEGTRPTKVEFEPPTIVVCPSSKLTVRWKPSTDADGTVVGYRVTIAGRAPVDVTGTSYTVEISGRVEVSVVAVDNNGNLSEPSTATYDVPVAICLPPTKPNLSVGEVTMTTITLNWTASVDSGGAIAGYDIFRNGTRIATVNGTVHSFVDRGLTPGTTYTYAVAARDADGLVGPKSDDVRATTPSEAGRDWDFAVTGSTSLKTVAKGNLPLTGSLTAFPLGWPSRFDAELKLGNTSGRLVAAGFLPVTAKLGFAFSGPTIVDVSNDETEVSTSSKVRIKVLDVKLFGAIPLVAGTSCQTKQLTDLTLRSAGAFSEQAGGKLTGTYKVSDLNGCGALNGLVSPLTAGGGNTISLALAPRG